MLRMPGFTLLELLVVLMIIGLVSTALVASLPEATGGTILQRDAARLAAGLKTARARAISQRRTTALAVDLDAKQLRIAGRSQRPEFVLHSTVTLRHAPQANQATAAMRFFPDGSADGGEFVVGDRQRALVVRVDRLTGRVTVHD